MPYATRADIEARFGPKNVALYADLDGNKNDTHIAARIESALKWADEEINGVLYGGAYAVPIQQFGSPAAYPAAIVDIAATLAGCWLYSARGTTDMGSSKTIQDRFAPLRLATYERLDAIRRGDFYLPGNEQAGCTPFIVPVDIETSDISEE